MKGSAAVNEFLKEYISERDYAAVARRAADWIAAWFEKNGKDSPVVIGISGGKDSTVVAALCVRALGKERVFGVLMPNGLQPDIGTSYDVVKTLGIKYAEINIDEAYDGVVASMRGAGIEPGTQTLVNLAPRIRMSTLYAVSQSLGGRVSNNGNRSERYVGYMTVWGDTAGDFAPLAGLTVTEVRLVGEALGLPTRFVHKPPSDGLTGKTDEDNLGFSYETLDTYILTGVCPDADARRLIDAKHRANLFKTLPMASFDPGC